MPAGSSSVSLPAVRLIIVLLAVPHAQPPACIDDDLCPRNGHPRAFRAGNQVISRMFIV
jgi:hypothetical protein